MSLHTIQPFLQAFANAISSIIDVDVTIVDRHLVRLGGTGEYVEHVGCKVPDGSFFKTVLMQGKPGMIADVHMENSCDGCEKRLHCKELGSLAFPIFDRGEIVGLIALIAFDSRQQQYLTSHQEKLEDFLHHMCVLMEGKIESVRVNIYLKHQIDDVISMTSDSFDSMVSGSKNMLHVIDRAKKVAKGNSSILITGESGTGKEVLAKAIHASSDRADSLLISVNCAAIPEGLVESELFGYEEGAFTGAQKGGKIGKFELASGSTIFLDEIGDMPLAVQAKLLRALQEGCIERVGGKKTIPVDIRVICATNKDLESMVMSHTFRKDLYYRVNVIPLTIPPLRDRRDDIPLLINYYLDHYSKTLKKPRIIVDRLAEAVLVNYDWPGNIRELKNIIEYFLNIIDRGSITVQDLPDYFFAGVVDIGHKTLDMMMQEYEKKLLQRYFHDKLPLEEKLKVAEKLSISIATMYRKLGKHKLL